MILSGNHHKDNAPVYIFIAAVIIFIIYMLLN